MNVISKFILTSILLTLITGCSSTQIEPGIYSKIRAPKVPGDAQREVSRAEEAPAEKTKDQETPKPPVSRATASDQRMDLAASLQGEDVKASFRDMPLPEFIHQIFGRILGFNFVVEPGLANSRDLITLSLSDPVAPADLYRTARTVLAEYGVGIVESEDLLRFRRDSEAAEDTPLLVTGATLPDVPVSRRPVFYMVDLEVVRNAQVASWLKTLFKGTDLKVLENANRNAVVLRGPLELVRQAAEIAEVFDQPLLKGKFSRSFTPTYLEVLQLTQDLISILTSEGYAVSDRPPPGSTIILPLVSQERIIVFANSQATLDHVLEWAYDLDAKEEAQISSGFFSYQAQNVTADHIANLISLIKGATAEVKEGEETSQTGSRSRGNRRGNRGDEIESRAYLGGKIVVDANRNVLFFNGSGPEWRDLLQLIEEVDKPVPMVLIDVLLAEVTLGSQDESGVEWLFNGNGIDHTNLTGSTLGGLGLGASGLSLTFDSAGETRAILNAFYSNDRAVIRSSPKLLVKSGEQAFIEVGNEIPIITSNSQSTDTPGAPVIQTIQYRKTGVLLSINPIVQASGMVDLVISQELSEEAVNVATSTTGSPIILNRKVDTSLSLHDGGSVLLGGLISSSQSDGQQGVPGFGKIPLFGKLFRTDIKTDNRTELLMLVTVYVINEHDEAVNLTNTLKERLNAPVE